MKHYHKQRMQKIIDFLRRLPPENFNLAEFVTIKNFEDIAGDDEAVEKEVKNLFSATESHNCGTTACVCGYLPVVFPRHFKYKGADIVPKCGTYDKWDIPRVFLGINSLSAFEYLFFITSYHPSKRGPKSVASRLEKVLRNDGKIPEKYKEYHT